MNRLTFPKPNSQPANLTAKTSRRQFIKHTSAVAGAALGSRFLGFPRLLAADTANPALRVALIGVGGQGGYSFDEAIKERIVAMCDVDEKATADKMKLFGERRSDLPAPKIYYDYRKMFDEYASEFDVVLIATPDHHHASASLRAIHHGKATFCQKPLCHDIAECYAVAKAAREKKVLTQMGNQGHCSDAIRKACEYIWDGAIGNVTETHSLLGRDFGGRGGRPPTQPVPAGLHWEEWIGPAPYRDYHRDLHPFNWRNWRDFGTGTIGDMACHNLDAVFWALKIGEAKTFTVECLHTEEGSDEKYPKKNIVRYEIPARGKFGPVKVHVYDQKELRPDVMKEAEKSCGLEFNEDTLFYPRTK
jgi:predicted dehydrogenase